MNIIEIIIVTIVFSFGYCVWWKVIDKAFNIMENKLTDKQYTIATWTLFVIIMLIFVYVSIFK